MYFVSSHVVIPVHGIGQDAGAVRRKTNAGLLRLLKRNKVTEKIR